MMTKKYLLLAGIVLVAIGAVAWYQQYSLSNRQAMVHEMGSHVMPFSLEETTHIFKQLSDGGVEQVLAKDPSNKEQVMLIQTHLEYETTSFRQGNFADPMKIHGENMPGVNELRQNVTNIIFTYHPLPDGAEIIYSSKNSGAISAIHTWFDAQVQDHGKDATGIY
ncbi:MAG: hypothetical protein HZB09_02000 [Candidatus Yonathbacteria bacterium]|nr:hypothetical protein [Candidatus Yonathbacteria bacterium]